MAFGESSSYGIFLGKFYFSSLHSVGFLTECWRLEVHRSMGKFIFLRLSSMGFFKENLIFWVNKGIFEDGVCLWDF